MVILSIWQPADSAFLWKFYGCSMIFYCKSARLSSGAGASGFFRKKPRPAYAHTTPRTCDLLQDQGIRLSISSSLLTSTKLSGTSPTMMLSAMGTVLVTSTS